MSKPRYKWWGYVKWCIRDYPAKCRELAELRRQSFGAGDGLPRGSEARRSTEDIALRGFAGQKEREHRGVDEAVRETRALPDGEAILRLVELVFWRGTHTLQGAAMACHTSEATARRWHNAFIRRVARHMGLLDD